MSRKPIIVIACWLFVLPWVAMTPISDYPEIFDNIVIEPVQDVARWLGRWQNHSRCGKGACQVIDGAGPSCEFVVGSWQDYWDCGTGGCQGQLIDGKNCRDSLDNWRETPLLDVSPTPKCSEFGPADMICAPSSTILDPECPPQTAGQEVRPCKKKELVGLQEFYTPHVKRPAPSLKRPL
jgi:hypothetical protein